MQQNQIATDFEVGFRLELSYTFGSAYNNIINTQLKTFSTLDGGLAVL